MSRRRAVVPAIDFLEAQASGQRLGKLAALTFDDGFADFASHAAPVLHRFGLPATMFVVAKTLEAGQAGADWLRPQPATAPPTLSADQVLELRASGVQFGSHSWAHLDLRELSEDECLRDLRDSRESLEDLLHEPVPLLAYPYGYHSAHVRRAAARAGYRYALSLPEGPELYNRQAVPRVGIYRRDSLTAVRIKATAWYLRLHMSRMNPVLRGGGRVLTLAARPSGSS